MQLLNKPTSQRQEGQPHQRAAATSATPQRSVSAPTEKSPVIRNAQDAAKPVTRVGNKAITPVKAGPVNQSKVTDDQMVENRLAGLMNPNSQLMRRAQASGMQFAASRGMQNSTLASEAVTAAMLDRAMPIAQQDAATHKDHALANAQRQFTSDQNDLNRQHDMTMVDKNLDANQALEQTKHQNNLSMESAQHGNRLKQLEVQGKIDLERQKIIESAADKRVATQLKAEADNLRTRIEADVATQLRNRTHETQMNYANTMSTAMNAALAQYSSIYSNTDMTPSQQRNAIATVRQDLQTQIMQLQAIYGVKPTGGGSASGGNTSGGWNFAGWNSSGGGFKWPPNMSP